MKGVGVWPGTALASPSAVTENLRVHVGCALEMNLSMSLSILSMKSGINTVSGKCWVRVSAGAALISPLVVSESLKLVLNTMKTFNAIHTIYKDTAANIPFPY